MSAQVLDKSEIKVGKESVFITKSQPRDNNVVSRHLPLTYDVFKANGHGLRGEAGKINVLLYANDSNGYNGSCKVVDKSGAEIGSLWISKNLVKNLLAVHQDATGTWVDAYKIHESGNATVRIDAKSVRIYGLKNTDTDDQWSVIGTVASGGAGIA